MLEEKAEKGVKAVVGAGGGDDGRIHLAHGRRGSESGFRTVYLERLRCACCRCHPFPSPWHRTSAPSVARHRTGMLDSLEPAGDDRVEVDVDAPGVKWTSAPSTLDLDMQVARTTPPARRVGARRNPA